MCCYGIDWMFEYNRIEIEIFWILLRNKLLSLKENLYQAVSNWVVIFLVSCLIFKQLYLTLW